MNLAVSQPLCIFLTNELSWDVTVINILGSSELKPDRIRRDTNIDNNNNNNRPLTVVSWISR